MRSSSSSSSMNDDDDIEMYDHNASCRLDPSSLVAALPNTDNNNDDDGGGGGERREKLDHYHPHRHSTDRR